MVSLLIERLLLARYIIHGLALLIWVICSIAHGLIHINLAMRAFDCILAHRSCATTHILLLLLLWLLLCLVI